MPERVFNYDIPLRYMQNYLNDYHDTHDGPNAGYSANGFCSVAENHYTDEEQESIGYYYLISRAAVRFFTDFSDLPGVVLVSAYIEADFTGEPQDVDAVHLVDGSGLSMNSDADYGLLLDRKVSFGSITGNESGTIQIPLNAAGLAAIAMNGETIFGLRFKKDIDDQQPPYDYHTSGVFSNLSLHVTYQAIPGTGIPSLAGDGTNIYALLDSNPVIVAKINPVTMTEIDRFTGETDEVAYGDNLRYLNGHLYVGVDNEALGEVAVFKIATNTMTKVAMWEGDAGSYYMTGVEVDATNVYASYNLGDDIHAEIVKIDPSDMTEVDRYEDETYLYLSLCCFGGYVYAGNLNDEIIIKLDPSTMEQTGSPWSSGESGGIEHIVAIGSRLYAESYNEAPLYVINPSTMVTITTYLGWWYPVTDGMYLYGGSYTGDGNVSVQQVDPADGSVVACWDSGQGIQVSVNLSQGGYIFAGFWGAGTPYLYKLSEGTPPATSETPSASVLDKLIAGGIL